MVSVILDNLAEGVNILQILSSYPTLTESDIFASLAYASEMVQEKIVKLP